MAAWNCLSSFYLIQFYSVLTQLLYHPHADGGDTIGELGAVQRASFEVESLLERYAKEKVVEGYLPAIVFGTTS